MHGCFFFWLGAFGQGLQGLECDPAGLHEAFLQHQCASPRLRWQATLTSIAVLCAALRDAADSDGEDREDDDDDDGCDDDDGDDGCGLAERATEAQELSKVIRSQCRVV